MNKNASFNEQHRTTELNAEESECAEIKKNET